MISQQKPAENWDACHGEVGYLVRNLKNRRRSAKFQRGVAAAFVMLLGLYTSYFNVVVLADIDLHSGDLTCDKVMQGFRQYLTAAYDHVTEVKFRRHLDHCSDCRKKMTEHLAQGQYRAPVMAERPTVVKNVEVSAESGAAAK